jgi:hypothetical protein
MVITMMDKSEDHLSHVEKGYLEKVGGVFLEQNYPRSIPVCLYYCIQYKRTLLPFFLD